MTISLASRVLIVLFPACLIGCVTVNAPNPPPQRLASDYITVYCAPSTAGDPYTLSAPAEYAKCRDDDTRLSAEEYDARQPAGRQFAAFMASRSPDGTPVKEWTSTSVPGDGSVFTFRSWRLGDPLDRAFGDYLIGQKRPGRPHCDVDVQRNLITCEDQSLLRRSSAGLAQSYVGDIAVDGLTYYFLLDRKLFGYSLNFPTPAFDSISAQLRNRYGAPHQEGNDIVRNRAGARFDAKFEIWNTPHGPMTLRSRHEAVNTGTLQLFDAVLGVDLPKFRAF